MSAVWGNVVGAFTVLLLLVFLGIWYWAWRPRHKATFDALARIPLHETRGNADDDGAAP